MKLYINETDYMNDKVIAVSDDRFYIYEADSLTMLQNITLPNMGYGTKLGIKKNTS